jgi:hypothetical protein
VRRDILHESALALFVAGTVCLAYGRTSAAAWRVPIDYHGDSWPTLALLKAAAEGHLVPLRQVVVPELGAPFDAGWNGFLRQHKLQYWLAGGLVRAVGLMPAANLLVPLAGALAASSFYFVCRYFRARPEWALVGAMAFALSPYFFYRGLNHLTLTFYWPLPLAVLVVAWVFGRRGLVLRSRRFAAAATIALAVGVHNIYYTGLLAQFLALAAAYLGLAGVLGLVCLSGVAAASYLRRPKGFVPAPFLAVCFILAVAVIRGLNAIPERWASSGSARRAATASGS